MYFLRGSLPWQGLKVDKKEDRYKKIYDKKKATTPEELCQGFPDEFMEYIHTTRKMGYEEDPDYEKLKNLFRNIMNRNGFVNDGHFDWFNLRVIFFLKLSYFVRMKKVIVLIL